MKEFMTCLEVAVFKNPLYAHDFAPEDFFISPPMKPRVEKKNNHIWIYPETSIKKRDIFGFRHTCTCYKDSAGNIERIFYSPTTFHATVGAFVHVTT